MPFVVAPGRSNALDPGPEYPVKNAIPHPNWDSVTTENDVGLIEVSIFLINLQMFNSTICTEGIK